MATTFGRAICITVIVVVSIATANNAWGEDWPSYRRDSQRSAVTSESLSFPLSAGWSFQPQHEPRRAWPRNFRENPWTKDKIRTLLTFDHAFHAVAAEGAVFFGSSADHKIYCLDAATGRPRWEFFTEGPIRCAPTVWEGNVYTGSDDGWLYCLAAATGDLLWKHRAGPTDERLPGNEQIISRWPIRSGVVVEDGVAYCAAGQFPHREGCFLSAVDATTGNPVWTEEINQVSQGYLLASQQRLCVPAGKMPPQIYSRASGKLLNRIASPAGTFAVING